MADSQQITALKKQPQELQVPSALFFQENYKALQQYTKNMLRWIIYAAEP